MTRDTLQKHIEMLKKVSGKMERLVRERGMLLNHHYKPQKRLVMVRIFVITEVFIHFILPATWQAEP